MSNAFKKFDLTDKTAVVTAGGTGMGYYMTRGLMRSGAKVLIAARRENVLQEAAEKLRSESEAGEVLYHTVDLADRASIKSFSDYAIDTLNGVDIFIGNAAQDIFEPLDSIADANIDQMLQVNLSSNMELTRNFLPHMRQNKWGRILFSSSCTSLLSAAQDGMSIYTATKSALNSFARTAAAETGHDGITVNSLALGVYRTEMMDELLERMEQTAGAEAVKAYTDSYTSMTALGRLARPDEVEGMIQFIASDAGSYFTGTTTALDGGMTSMLRPNTPPEAPVYPPEF